jgi:hypothetical protein
MGTLYIFIGKNENLKRNFYMYDGIIYSLDFWRIIVDTFIYVYVDRENLLY